MVIFENKTFGQILEEKLSLVSDGTDKSEGAVIYDTLAPNSAETAEIYSALDEVLGQIFADTAEGEYLELRCRERGIERRDGTFSEGIIVTDACLDLGDEPLLFENGEFTFEVTGEAPPPNENNEESYENGESEDDEESEEEENPDEEIQYYYYRCKCTAEGSESNGCGGAVIPSEDVPGLGYAVLLTPLLVAGRDEESDEDLRKRYYATFDYNANGFNFAQYKSTLERFGCVGGATANRGDGGEVNVYLLDKNFYGGVNEDEKSSIKEYLDPTEYSGCGAGAVPVGHKVTVSNAEQCTVGSIADKITATVAINGSSTLSADDISLIKALFREVLVNYYREMNKLYFGKKYNSKVILKSSEAVNEIMDRCTKGEGVTARIIDISDFAFGTAGSIKTADENYKYAFLGEGDVFDLTFVYID